MRKVFTPDQVLNFWFKESTPTQWFQKSSEYDNLIKERFEELLHQAEMVELFDWRGSARGALAEIIVLDQFSRNMYRDTPRSFANDPLALALAQEFVAKGFDRDLNPSEKNFAYMPFMHSESLVVHEIAVKLFNQPGLENGLDYEFRHLEILKRFGRYPHRNAILGRESSQEELEFLAQPGSGF